jgi:hypothetical protein
MVQIAGIAPLSLHGTIRNLKWEKPRARRRAGEASSRNRLRGPRRGVRTVRVARRRCGQGNCVQVYELVKRKTGTLKYKGRGAPSWFVQNEGRKVLEGMTPSGSKDAMANR